MVKKYVFICSKCEECLYTCLKQFASGEGGFTLQEEATTSIQHKAKKKKRKHKRKRNGELHALFPYKEQLVDVNFLYRETHRTRES